MYSISFVVLLLCSCKSGSTAKDSLSLNALGIEVSQDQVIDVQRDVLLKRNPSLIREGDFVYSMTRQYVYSSQQPISQLISEEGITVGSLETFGDILQVTTFREDIDHTQDGSPSFKFKEVFAFELNTENKKNYEKFQLFSDKEFAEKFYDLNVVDTIYTLPNCTENCEWPVKRISYTYAFIENEKVIQKNLVETDISSTAPFFASILRNCITTIIEIDNSRPLVQQCKTVERIENTQ